MLKKLPAFTKNFYFIFGLLFLIWMLFIDTNDLFSQYQQARRIDKLEEKKDYYQQKIKEVKQDREELLSDKELLEKFAREKYLMKKKNEDVFVIVEE